MKRTLSGIASAAIVLGAISPMAFADTSSSGLTPAHQVPIVVNGQILSNPYEMVGVDSGNQTAFFPIYYFDQALAKIGITATWNGATHTWALTDANISNPASVQVAGGVGTGNTTVTLNGTTIKMFNTQAAKDPAGGPVTTYMPAYYVGNILTALGINNSFNPNVGLVITTPQATSITLSQIAVTGQSVGTGTISSPAVVQNPSGGSLTLSTTVTDQNGNPVANQALTVSIYGQNVPSSVSSNGTTLSTSRISGGWSTTVSTNSQGVASLTISGLGAYKVVFGPSGAASAQSQTAYIGFTSTNGVITPQWSVTQNVSTPANPSNGVVPIVVALPYSNGKPQSGVQVTFRLYTQSPAVSGSPGAFFSTSSGQNISDTYTSQTVYNNGQGWQYTTYTDANGEAVVYVNDYNPDSNVYVTATAGGTTLTTTALNYTNPNAPAGSSPIAQIGLSTSVPYSTVEYPSSLSNLSGSSVVYVVPEGSSSGYSGLSGSQLNDVYTLNVSTGYITTINNVNVANVLGANGYGAGTPSTLQVSVWYNSSANAYQIYVDGYALNNPNNNNLNAWTNPYFSVGVSTGNAADTLTVTDQNGNKATASYVASPYPANAVAGVSPQTSTVSNAVNHSETVQLYVVDQNGNPVANAPVTLSYDNNENNLWITQVNGTTLTGSFNGVTEPTPIPLYTVSNLGYNYVYVPGVASWNSGSKTFTVYTNSTGWVSLTVQAGNVGYYSTGNTIAVSPAVPNGDTSTTVSVYSWTKPGVNPDTSTYGEAYLGLGAYNSNATQIGTLTW